jgi:hypothetical protein
MTPPTDPLAGILARITAVEQAATQGPWTHDEDELMWRLHGTAYMTEARLDGRIPPQRLTLQILKAPKTGTPYAEYWPVPQDAAFITEARTALPALLAVARRLAEAHQPRPVCKIAKYATGPSVRNGRLMCGHPVAALGDGRHELNGDEEWACLDQVDYVACTGCQEGESGEESDFASCEVRKVLAEELGRLAAGS